MNSKLFALFAVFLVVSSFVPTHADWLDDLEQGTNQLANDVNYHAGRVHNIARNIHNLGKIIRDVDPGSDESDE